MRYRTPEFLTFAVLALCAGTSAIGQQGRHFEDTGTSVPNDALIAGVDGSDEVIHEASIMIEVFDAVDLGDSKPGGKGCNCDSCLGGKGDGKAGCAAIRKAAAASHKGVFYANDFSYLANAGCCETYLGDRFKRLPVGDCWMVDVGGQYRMRYHHEQNINNVGIPNFLGLTGDDDDFLLHRTRLYLNAEYGSHFRFYGEMLDAASELGSGPPRVIEENRTELQNLFVEFKGYDLGRGTIGARVGRQEIMLGAQRMVSPLDWGNTRRTFDGARAMWKGETWDIDGFWLRPMHRDAAHAKKLDPPNLDRQLYGLYGTYKGLCRDNLEAYWLALDYEDILPSGFRYDTLGTRYWGSEGDWLYELEAAVQFGTNADNTGHGRRSSHSRIGPQIPLYDLFTYAVGLLRLGVRCQCRGQRISPLRTVGPQVQRVHGHLWPPKSPGYERPVDGQPNRQGAVVDLVSLFPARQWQRRPLQRRHDSLQWSDRRIER